MLASSSLPSLRGRHLLAVHDLGADELDLVLHAARRLKRGRAVEQLGLLRGKTLGMLFEKPSLRTRVSFEVAMTQLGGHALHATAGDFQLGSRESPEDAARVLSRFVDAIVVRTHAHEPLERFAGAATVPVINALSAVAHPCQGLADLMTVGERLGALQGLRIAFLGDARNNVAASLAEAAMLCGVSVRFGAPATHQPNTAELRRLERIGTPRGATARAFASATRAVRGADVVYTDVWTSMGDEAMSERNAAALIPYRVTEALMQLAAPHAVFMHCLPAHRGDEVDAAVIDGPRSAVFDQAENRLHAQKALLLALMTDLRGIAA